MKITKQRLKEIIREEIIREEILKEAEPEDREQSAFRDFVHGKTLSKEDLRAIQTQIALLLDDPATPEK